MIPIRDHNKPLSRPIINYSLIAINIVVFLHEWSLGPLGMRVFVDTWGVVPYGLLNEPELERWLTPLTSIFMHGGWMHLIGNMWFLHVFGDNVEDNLGRSRYLVFYLLCGLGAVAAQVFIDPWSRIPMVGASGAIAGVLGGYVALHPRARILTLVPIFIFIQFAEIPAYFFIFVWFGYQLLMGFTSLGQMHVGGVAFFAHIGGFLVGLLLIGFFKRSVNRTHGWRGARQSNAYRSWD